MTCIFCDIINGKIPCSKIYENDSVVAFLDIKPINPGHTLAVPKCHAESLKDLHDGDIAMLFQTIKKIAPAILKATGATAYNIGMNNGREAGQAVMHAHIHIIPRFANDGLHHWPGKDAKDLEEVKGKILVKLLAAKQ